MDKAQYQQPQDLLTDTSSVAPASQNLGHRDEASILDADNPPIYKIDTDAEARHVFEDSAGESLDRGCHARPSLEDQSSIPSSVQYCATGLELDMIPAMCHQPLLSPFTPIKNEPSMLAESVEIHSTRLQHSLDSFPSSSPIQPVSSDPISNASSPPTDILQSPFCGIVQPVSTAPKFASIPSSPRTSPAPIGSSPTGSPEFKKAINFGTETHGDSSSDSVEITIIIPSTPTTIQDISEETSSSHTKAEKGFPEAQAICSDDVIKYDVTSPRFQDILEPSSPKLQEVLSELIASSEEMPMKDICSRSPSVEGTSVVTPSSRNSSPNKSPQPTPQVLANKSTPQKRPLELDDLDHPPALKRMTLASQKKQHKKLASPFRSPLLSKPNPNNISTPEPASAVLLQPSPLSSLPRPDNDKDKLSTPLKKTESRTASTTPRLQGLKSGSVGKSLFTSVKAAAQFKSPIKSSTSTNTVPRSTTSRDIQELDRKVQLLKRAIKIKKDEDEEKLEQLVKKWREVGREAAWELWQIVRDNDETSDSTYPGTNSKSKAGSSSGSWGWADQAGNGLNDRNWGWDKPPDNGAECKEEEEDDTSDFESPKKLERRLLETLSKKPTVPRTSMLPPTPRGAYFERRAVPQDFNSYDEGDCTSKEEEEEPQPSKPAKSLGTMLHQIGIAHETLGWVEDEGDFVDA